MYVRTCRPAGPQPAARMRQSFADSELTLTAVTSTSWSATRMLVQHVRNQAIMELAVQLAALPSSVQQKYPPVWFCSSAGCD